MEDTKRLLLIVDPQTDFVTGSLKVKGGQDAMDRLAYWLITTNTKFDMIVFSEDCHPTDHCSFIENGGQFPKHCVSGTQGADLYEPVRMAIERYCNEKHAGLGVLVKGMLKDVEEFSALSSESNRDEFLRILNTNGINEIWVAGLASDYCVLDTLKDIISITQDTADIVFLDNCTAAVDPNGPRQKEFISILNSPDVVGICDVQEVNKGGCNG